MGHDEDTNNFNAGGNSPVTPVTPNPRAQLGNNRLGMRPARNLSAKEELDRISADSNPNAAASNGDIVLNAGAKPKKDKKIIVIIVLAIVTVIAIIASLFITKSGFLGASGTKTVSKDEASAALQEFQSGYKEFANNYNETFGLTPKVGSWNIVMLFPLPEHYILSLEELNNDLSESYSKTIADIRTIDGASDDQQKTFNEIKTGAKKLIDDSKNNIETTKKFYNAFAKPVVDSYYLTKKAVKCEKTNEINELLNSGNEKLKESAEKFYEVFCDITNKNYLSMDINEFKAVTDSKVKEASTPLREGLITIEKTYVDEINNLAKGLLE